MNTKKLSVQSSIIWNSIGSIIYLITQWLISVLVVRISGVEVAGNLTLAMSINNVFYSIAIQGIRNYQVSDVKEKYENGIYVGSRLISCSIAIFICVIYCLIIDYSSQQKACIIAYCLFKISEALYDVYAGICQKSWRMDYIGKSWMVKGIITLIAFLMGLLLTSNLFVAIICMTISSFVVIILYDIPRVKSLTNVNVELLDKRIFLLMKECFPLFCYLILSTVISTIPRVFMERILGSYALGVYGSIAAPTLIVQMGASYVFNPFLTLFAEQYHLGRGKEFCNTLKKCVVAIGGLSIVSLIGGRILGRWGLMLLYGQEVAEYEYLLLPLILCTILTAMVWFLCALLTVVRDFRGLILSNLIAVIISCLCSKVFLNQFDIQGASIALILSLAIEILCLWKFLSKKIEEIK